MNAYLYARFSPRPDAAECQSVLTQIERCTAYCKAHGYIIAATFRDEGLSGGTMARPGLLQAIDAACEAKGILVVYSLDRLARNTRDAIEISERLESADANMACVMQSIDTHSPAGRFFFTILAALATMEREQTSERTSVAMKAHQARGRRMGRRDRCPYGWKADGEKGLKPVAEEQKVIELVKSLHGMGMDWNAVRKELKDRKIRCRGKDRWQNPVLEKMVG